MDFEAIIKAYIERSPRLAPYRKTVAGLITTAGALVLFLASLPTQFLPPSVTGAVAVAAAVITGLTYFVPNDLTTKQVHELETYGRHAKRD